MLGKVVTVKVDRHLGSFHPKHKDIYYPINYGYIEGIMAPDGEEYTVEQIEKAVHFQEQYFEYDIIMRKV